MINYMFIMLNSNRAIKRLQVGGQFPYGLIADDEFKQFYSDNSVNTYEKLQADLYSDNKKPKAQDADLMLNHNLYETLFDDPPEDFDLTLHIPHNRHSRAIGAEVTWTLNDITDASTSTANIDSNIRRYMYNLSKRLNIDLNNVYVYKTMQNGKPMYSFMLRLPSGYNLNRWTNVANNLMKKMGKKYNLSRDGSVVIANGNQAYGTQNHVYITISNID